MNPPALFDLFIFGYRFVPGHHCDNYVRYQGVLMDVQEGFIYAIKYGKGEMKTTRPLIFAENNLGLDFSRNLALNDLCSKFEALVH